MRFSMMGKYTVRLAENGKDVRRAQRLRHLAFISASDTSRQKQSLDADAFDAVCDHLLIEDAKTEELACCYRLLPMENGADIENSYSAQFYDLRSLSAFPDRVVEMGRFCVHPNHRNGHVIRIAWTAMARYVDARNIKLLIGCSSFHGVNAASYEEAFALLNEHHLAPPQWLPKPKAQYIFDFARHLNRLRPDPMRAMRLMPPLLRGYLAMGGWVSDHAVIDHEMNTLHVFTGLEVNRVPERMSAALRRV